MSKDNPIMLVTIKEVQGAIAKWVCRQSPYASVDGVDNVNRALAARIEDWELVGNLRMQRFSFSGLNQWLKNQFRELPQTQQWNTRSNGGQGMGMVDRYHTTPADRDFIDIDALRRNVLNEIWSEALEAPEVHDDPTVGRE